jgi:hypothetical protein
MNESIQAVISRIVGGLVDAMEKSLDQRKATLIEQNYALGGSILGFVFSGTIYADAANRKAASREVRPIHADLFEDAQILHQEILHFEKDRQLLTQGLNILLAPCTSWQDIRDALPDCAKGILEQTSKLTRTRKEAWTLERHPMQLHAYGATKRCITLFMAERMLI